jgi:hypothetical protein
MPWRGPTTTTTTMTTRGGTRRRWTDNDNDDDNNNNATEGDDCSNGTISGQRYGRPHNRHPVRGPGVVHIKASAWICAGIQSWTMMGWGGRGGEVGNTMESAYSMTTMNTMTWRMGRGCAGEQTTRGNSTTMVATSSAGILLVAWGIGCQSLAPTPPPPSLTTMTMMTIAIVVGGCRAPPPLVRPIPPDAACHC